MRVDLHEGPIGPLLQDWTALHAARTTATPFMGPAWAGAWDAHLRAGAQPFVLVVREGDTVVGIAPWVLRRRGPLRLLGPWGMDPGDYWDVLAAPDRAAAVAAAAMEALSARRREWDAWLLRCPPPGSPVVGAIDAAGLRSLVRPGIPDPVIELPESFDAYLKGLSSNRRSNLRKHLRRLDEGQIELRTVTDPAALPDAIARWQGFRRAQWAAQDKSINPSHLAPELAAFVTDAARGGAAFVWEFLVDGDVAGTYVNLADEHAFHWWLGGFDPAHAKLGLGKVAVGHGIRTSIDAGRARFDFGRGAEPYKYWYGAQDRLLDGRVVLSGGPRSRLAEAAARAAFGVQAVRARRDAD